jgi:hypothetical protein
MKISRVIVWIASALVVASASAGAQTPPSSRAVPSVAPSTSTARDISGFWALSIDGRKVPPAKLLPRVTKALLDLHARQDVHAIRWCNPVGMPLIMDSGSAIEIRQGPTTIFIAPENSLVPRYVYLNRKHVSAEIYDPSTSGDSVASWEGDTLVVDTVGFHPTHGVTSIPGGGFRTDKTHLVERYRLAENGEVLSVRFTWTDPTVFSAPHTYEYRYRRLPPTYEPAGMWPCDPYDEERAQFLGDPAPFKIEKR